MALCKSCHSSITAESGDRWGYLSSSNAAARLWWSFDAPPSFLLIVKMQPQQSGRQMFKKCPMVRRSRGYDESLVSIGFYRPRERYHCACEYSIVLELYEYRLFWREIRTLIIDTHRIITRVVLSIVLSAHFIQNSLRLPIDM